MRFCVCGSEVKTVRLPAEIAEMADQHSIWIHVHNCDTRCYPESDNAADREATVMLEES